MLLLRDSSCHRHCIVVMMLWWLRIAVVWLCATLQVVGKMGKDCRGDCRKRLLEIGGYGRCLVDQHFSGCIAAAHSTTTVTSTQSTLMTSKNGHTPTLSSERVQILQRIQCLQLHRSVRDKSARCRARRKANVTKRVRGHLVRCRWGSINNRLHFCNYTKSANIPRLTTRTVPASHNSSVGVG